MVRVLGGKWLHAGAKPIFSKNYKKISGKRVENKDQT